MHIPNPQRRVCGLYDVLNELVLFHPPIACQLHIRSAHCYLYHNLRAPDTKPLRSPINLTYQSVSGMKAKSLTNGQQVNNPPPLLNTLCCQHLFPRLHHRIHNNV